MHDESAKAAPLILCRRPKHSQRKGRIAIVRTRLLSQGASHRLLRREQVTLIPSINQESHSRCARVLVLNGLLPLHSASAELGCLPDDASCDSYACVKKLVPLLRFIVHRFHRL